MRLGELPAEAFITVPQANAARPLYQVIPAGQQKTG